MKTIFNFNKSRTKKYLIKKFNKKNGLLYFGSVNQNKDEHKIIRGFTLSPTHHDDYFSVGSVCGYDINFVDRKDAIWNLDGTTISQNWLIMTIKLKTKQDLPHFLIKPKHHSDLAFIPFFETYSSISEISLGAFEDYPENFIEKYSIYTRQSLSIQMQRLFTADTARIFCEHFWPLTIEQNDNCIYIYSTDLKISENLLNAMLENGLWLASQIDYQAELI